MPVSLPRQAVGRVASTLRAAAQSGETPLQALRNICEMAERREEALQHADRVQEDLRQLQRALFETLPAMIAQMEEMQRISAITLNHMSEVRDASIAVADDAAASRHVVTTAVTTILHQQARMTQAFLAMTAAIEAADGVRPARALPSSGAMTSG